MPRFPLTKKDKREVIEDFIQHMEMNGVVFASESEDENGKVELDAFTGSPTLINTFLNQKPKQDEEE